MEAVIPMLIGAGTSLVNTAMSKPPTPTKPKVAPVADDKQMRIKSERSAARAYAGQGRAGTALTESNTLG